MLLCLFVVHSFEKMLLENKAASFEYAKQEYSPSDILLLYSYDWNSCYGSGKSKKMCLQSHQLKRIGFPRCGSGDFLGFLSNTATLAVEGYFNKHLYCSFILEYTIKTRRGKKIHVFNLPSGETPEIWGMWENRFFPIALSSLLCFFYTCCWGTFILSPERPLWLYKLQYGWQRRWKLCSSNLHLPCQPQSSLLLRVKQKGERSNLLLSTPCRWYRHLPGGQT